MTDYYDIVLGVIPVTLVGFSGLFLLLGFDLTTAVPLAALVPVGVIGHAMFVHGPTDAVEESTTTTDTTESPIDVSAD